jgi:hypothetical protein
VLLAGVLAVVTVAAAAVTIVVLTSRGDSTKAGRSTPVAPSGSFTSSATPSQAPSSAAPAVTTTEIHELLDRYQAAYSDEDAARLRNLFADELVRRNGADAPEELEQALSTYQSQFDRLSHPIYVLSGVTVAGGRGGGRAVGTYTISSDKGQTRGRIAFHVSARGGRLLIDRITIRPS